MPACTMRSYQFPDMAKLDAALRSQAFRGLVADSRSGISGSGLARARDVVNLVEEQSAGWCYEWPVRKILPPMSIISVCRAAFFRDLRRRGLRRVAECYRSRNRCRHRPEINSGRRRREEPSDWRHARNSIGVISGISGNGHDAVAKLRPRSPPGFRWRRGFAPSLPDIVMARCRKQRECAGPGRDMIVRRRRALHRQMPGSPAARDLASAERSRKLNGALQLTESRPVLQCRSNCWREVRAASEHR